MPEGITVWTAERVAVLRTYAYGRKTPAEIASMMGVSEDAVRTKASKIGVRFTSTLQPHVRSRILDYAAAGWRPSRIAKQLRLDLALVEIHLATVSPGSASSASSPS